MEIFHRLVSIASAFFSNLFPAKVSYRPSNSPTAEIGIATTGAFWTGTALRLEAGLGWTGNATRFSGFHRQPAWYGKPLVDRLKQAVSGQRRADAWVFEPEFYYFPGGRPISGIVVCPRAVSCMLAAAWEDTAWVVSSTLFSPRRSQAPVRITNVSQTNHSHVVFVTGPATGRLHFNPIQLGLRAFANVYLGLPPKETPLVELFPLALPSGLPDGVLSFH